MGAVEAIAPPTQTYTFATSKLTAYICALVAEELNILGGKWEIGVEEAWVNQSAVALVGLRGPLGTNPHRLVAIANTVMEKVGNDKTRQKIGTDGLIGLISETVG